MNLKNVMITPFDLFDRDIMIYTIKNGCAEEPDMPYDDVAITIFLYLLRKILKEKVLRSKLFEFFADIIYKMNISRKI